MKVQCVKCEKEKHPVCFTPSQLKAKYGPICRECLKEGRERYFATYGRISRGMVRL